ncbi:3-deoxy-7-phosphoheptulonate synthase, partial [Spirochaetota bacterium]
LHVSQILPIRTPKNLRESLPLTDELSEHVSGTRQVIMDVLDGKDNRFLMFTGPCSIHDVDAAMEYAGKLKVLSEKYKDTIYFVMRVYVEKPRSTIGWKGLINDPLLNGSHDIDNGLYLARKFLLDISTLGLATCTEMLDPVGQQFTSDIISWAAIGARTVESQIHREMVSGSSMPVGFKNSTDGSVEIAISAMKSSAHPHSFIGINEEGMASIVKTKGNPYTHIVLRGGEDRPNFDRVSVEHVISLLEKEKLRSRVIIDCSHGNSFKDHSKQPTVLKDVLRQRIDGNGNIAGVMIESFLEEGNQSIPENLDDLKYGVSVTDKCVGWETTEEMAEMTHDYMKREMG